MKFNEYQTSAKATAVYPADSALVYTVLGLTSEAGEVADKVKKIIRDHQGVFTDDHKAAIMTELGDVMWYTAMVADVLGFDLETVAVSNISKLESRQNRGVLSGSGDNR